VLSLVYSVTVPINLGRKPENWAIDDLKKAASLYKDGGNQKFYQDALEVLKMLGVR
jgi:hypothetical protein